MRLFPVFLLSSFLFLNDVLAYELRVIQTQGYSRPWIVVSADGADFSKLNQGRIHFHGWTQYRENGKPYHPHYDFLWENPDKSPDIEDLKKFVEAYGVQREVEKNPDMLMVIPVSRGRCDDYPQIHQVSTFDQAVQNLLQELGIAFPDFKFVHLSAHSGGGKVLSELLEKASESRFLSPSAKVTLYDAIYGEDWKNRILIWMNSTGPGQHRQLDLFTLPGQTPSKFSGMILNSIPSSAQTSTWMVKGNAFFEEKKIFQNQVTVRRIQETLPLELNHWSLVEFFWD